MINPKTFKPWHIAFAHEYIEHGASFKKAAMELGKKRRRKVNPDRLRQKYRIAMEHGLAAWGSQV